MILAWASPFKICVTNFSLFSPKFALKHMYTVLSVKLYIFTAGTGR